VSYLEYRKGLDNYQNQLPEVQFHVKFSCSGKNSDKFKFNFFLLKMILCLDMIVFYLQYICIFVSKIFCLPFSRIIPCIDDLFDNKTVNYNLN
jgi:hypothetical protein